MMQRVRAVVVGGGAVGLSVLYHLCKKGWTDSVLFERAELTSGATWRAAGHVILYTQNSTVLALNRYGVDLYKTLHAETGQDPGFHVCGNLRLATHKERLLEFERFMGLAELHGVPTELLSAKEVKRLWPLLETEGVYGGLFNPTDGHISPADLAQSFAAGARQQGASIRRNTDVTALRRENGEWIVSTGVGEVACEHVVLCTGLHTQRTFDMVGLAAHAIPIMHQYIITDAVPELVERKRAGLPELPVMRDPEQSFYVRQEGVSLLFGAYETGARTFFPDRVPDSFTQEAFPGDLEVLLPYLETAMARVPVLERAGIQTLVPGIKPYSPDDMPITGPAPGHDNLWLAEGNPFGITLSGGIGWQIADWIVEGQPSIDMTACDPRRFGNYATRRYVAVKTEEAYERTYTVPKPDEELPAARPLRTSPIHDLLAARGAVFGSDQGWEVPNWFAPSVTEAVERWSYEQSSYFDQVAAECRALDTAAGLADASADARFRVSGAQAAAALACFFATAVPRRVGEVALAIAVSPAGRIVTAMRVAVEARDCYLLTSSPSAEAYNADLLARCCGSAEAVRLDRLTGFLVGLRLAGPGAEAILQEAAGPAFRIETACQSVTIGLAPATVVREEDGFVVLTTADLLRHVFNRLVEVGGTSLSLCGARAFASRRVEQGLPRWGLDYGMGEGLATLGWPDQSVTSFGRRLVQLDLGSRSTFLPSGSEPVRVGGDLVGHTTSGGFGHGSGRAYALALVEDAVALRGKAIEVKLFGSWVPGIVSQMACPK